MGKIKGKNKKGLATILVLAILVCVCSVMISSFINKAAYNNGYVTKDVLINKDAFSQNEQIGKLIFGKNEDGSAQEWYLVGKDAALEGDNVVIVAANPIKANQVFEDEGKRNKKDTALWEDCSYAMGNGVTEVHPNHYGASSLRATFKEMMQEDTYFSDAQKTLMNATTITTYDTRNRVEYTTTDKLYALSSVDGVLYAGSANDIRVDMDATEWFWLRTAPSMMQNKGDVLTANGENKETSVSVDMGRGVLPVANLDVSSVLFASAAPSTGAGTLDKTAAMTLKMDGSNQAFGDVVYDANSNKIMARCADEEKPVTLIVVSGDNEWYYSQTIEDKAIVSAQMIQEAVGTQSNISLAECSIWIEMTGEEDQLTYAKMAVEDTVVDPNGDNVLGVADIVRYERVIANVDGTAFAEGYQADLSGDGNVTEADAEMLRDYILSDTIMLSDITEKNGLDGTIATNEYSGETLEGTATDYKATVKGFLTSKKNARLAIEIQSNFNPKETQNGFGGVGRHLFAEIAFGENSGENSEGNPVAYVKANVLGEAENAEAVANTVANAEEAEYRYTTTIEIWVPSSSFTNNTIPEDVQISRFIFFNGEALEGVSPNNIFLVAKWANLNPCRMTRSGISKTLIVPENEAVGLDGVISAGEYKGTTIDNSVSDAGTYKMTTQGYLTEQNNIRLGVTIYSDKDLTQVYNPARLWSEYMFAEFAFGDNTGEGCNTIYADVRGRVKDAVTAIKTTKLEGDATYRYKTVIEMWIPQSAITNNTTPDKVQFTRAGLFHEKIAADQQTWLVAKWAGFNNCYITPQGIMPTDLLNLNIDGVITENEYGGEVLKSVNAGISTEQYHMEVQGYLLDDAHNIKVALKIDSVNAPESVVNDGEWSPYFSVKMALGSQCAEDSNAFVYADVMGNAEGARTVVQTTDNGTEATYRYTTIIEMYVPSSSIQLNDNSSLVHLPMVYMYANTLGSEGYAKMVERNSSGVGNYAWRRFTVNGIEG